MSRNVEVSIKVEFKSTEEQPTAAAPEQFGEGCFRLVLPEQQELDIDALEAGLLRTNYSALRDALSVHLTQAVKKSLGAAAS